mgnify:CR=1 FL=1
MDEIENKMSSAILHFEKELNGVMPFEIVLTYNDTVYESFSNISKIEIFDFPEILEIFVGAVSKNGGF